MTSLPEFFKNKRQALVGYVRRRIDDAADQEAEDIVQDVILSLFDRADPTVPIQNLGAFVYRSLRNRIVDRFRKQRELLPLMEAVLESGDDPVLELERRETLEATFAAIDRLSAGEKAVVLATEFEGRTFQELAGEWGVPIGTLLSRKKRALEKIRRELTGWKDTNQGVTK